MTNGARPSTFSNQDGTQSAFLHAGTRMCPAAAGGGASGKNHAFCPKQRWAGQDARIQRFKKEAERRPRQCGGR